MKLTVFTNFLNHHQVQVMDQLYNLLGNDFRFVTTLLSDQEYMKGGDDYSNRSYCLCAARDKSTFTEALRLAIESETCIFGADSYEFAIARAKQNPMGLSFEMGERWLKRGWVNVISPNFLKWWLNYIRYFRKANFYQLCCSAFASIDMQKLHTYENRCYKWGYFTHVDESFDTEISMGDVSTSEVISFMWCSRYLRWKHPELPVRMAARLKAEGYKFILDMYGHGVVFDITKRLAKQLNVEDVVIFKGNLSNEQILQAMREHKVFLFTSDQNEGWGAVANESMSNGCVLIGSDATGAVPYLLVDGVNGLIFESCNLDSLCEKAKYILDNPKELHRLSRNGIATMRSIWSPKNAAKNLICLINQINYQDFSIILQGPCSKA